MAKLTDEQIGAINTKRMMLVQIGYHNYAMQSRDAIALLDIFTRAIKVEQIHTSDYRRSVYIVAADQEPPFDSASMGDVETPIPVDPPDRFSAATRDVS